MGAVPSPLGGHRPHPTPRLRNTVFLVLTTFIVLGWVGTALLATLVDRHPLALLLLNPTPKYQVLVTNSLDWWSYYPAALVRLMITKPLMWLLGAWYGERAVAWAARRSESSARVIRWLQARFDRVGPIVVVATSGNPVCLLAGSTGMPLTLFLALAATGTILRLWIVRRFGTLLSSPIDEVLSFIAEHRLAVTVTVVLTLGIALLIQHRRGRSDLGDLEQLERDTQTAQPARRRPPNGTTPPADADDS